MRKKMGVITGVFSMMLFGALAGCPGVIDGGNTNTNTNDNTGDDNMNDNTGDDNMNDNTGDDNMNDNTGDDNMNDNTGDDNGDDMTGGDAAAGMAFYTGNGCVACHGEDASGGIGPDLAGVDAATMLANLDGSDPHPATVEGVTAADADNLVAYVASLQ